MRRADLNDHRDDLTSGVGLHIGLVVSELVALALPNVARRGVEVGSRDLHLALDVAVWVRGDLREHLGAASGPKRVTDGRTTRRRGAELAVRSDARSKHQEGGGGGELEHDEG